MARLDGQLTILRREVPALEAEEERLGAELDRLTHAITTVRNDRRAALYDNDMQLRLKAGQVEAEPPGLVSAGEGRAGCRQVRGGPLACWAQHMFLIIMTV